MPEEKDKIKKLYDTFVSDGYDMESEEDFRKNLLDSTKRKAAYDALVKDGYDMEPFEEFESNIGFGKERTSSQQSGNSASGTVEEPISPANEQTWQPTEKEKVAMLTETDRIMNDVKSHTQTFNERIDNMQEYGINPGLQTKEGKMIFNPESGKLEKTFLTPAGNRYYSKSLADMESFQYRQAADMSIGGQLRKANLRLQELKAKQEERASEVHKEWAEETENNKAPLAAILGAATYTPRQQSDKENRALSVAIRETEELIKNLEEQKDRENGVDVGFWRGFGRTMGDVRTWDFGMGDMRDAFTMMNADELKKENATEGEREAHDAMMGAIHEKQQAEERYSGNADFWNRAGVMTGYMPSFMLDFVLTGGGFNGLSSFSKGSTRLATKVISKETAEKMAQQGFKSYIKENGAKGLGRYATDWTIKALGTTADDLLVRAPLMANTVQAGKTTADIIDRKLGDVVVDENGNYDFSNDKTWGDAIWQSEANAIIENYSEMFGAHLDPVFTLGNMSKLAKVVGAKRIGTVLSKADASALNGIMGQTHQMFNKMGMSDYVGEVSEEYYGQLWRTMLNLDDAYQQNPDGTRTNLFASGQFHGDIWGGMALSMGLMGAGKHTLSAANYTSMKHGVNKADAKVNELLGKEVWEPLKETLDLTTNENIGEVAELIAGDKDFTINEKAAVLDYMERSLNLRGFNLASMAQSRGGNRNESVQQANDSYLDGYNIISSQEMNDAKNMYEYQRARVADLVDESMFAMIEENPIAALEFVNGNEQWNDEDKVSVIDYINAKQVYNGMIQRVRDDIDGRIEQSNSMIDARVNRNTGMIQGATMKQDERKVYVISGKLVPYDDGSGVSVTDSDNSIIIRDSETGALEQVSPDAVLSLDESQDPNEQKELAEQAIVEQFAREAADKIDGKVTFNPGDAYTITGQDGSQMQVQIIANEDGIVDNGDGTVNVSDGVNIFPLAKETIQQQADAANLARVAQFEQQRTIENAERKQEMQEAERPQYALNDIVSLTDENGVTVRGNITADADADGKYEVFTEAPINGKRVNLFTRDELDNMLLEHNGVAFERPVENESNNGAENIPENDNNAPQNIPAMQRIPKDEQGNPLYEQADSDTAWDAIVEQTEGDEDMAQTVVDGMVADKEEALKKLEKAKSKGGNSIAEKIASEKERKAAIDAAKQELLVWQKIAGTAKRRKMEADDERRRIADEAAALRKAEEEKLRAEREEAERIEREALNGVPDMVDDKPQDARARGYRRMNGHKIDRQEPVQALQGKEVSVKFSDDAIVGGRVAVIDVNLLQPSHIQGVRNPLHFIDEAQPKERNDEASVLSARKIAGNIRPEEITSSVTAYTGAPTVNARGEAIQGNNRSDALRIMWENHPEQAALYKQYLKDHAEEFGLQAEDIEAMEHPVLVNMVDVDDAEAIRLGQYVAQDTESGGVERIKPKNALQRMGAEMRSFANLLLRTSDDEMSFAGLVDSNGANVLKWMSQRGFITPTQYKSAFDSKGNLTPESKNDLRGIMYQSIFKDGSTRLEEMFNVLPVKAQKAILATAFRDYDSPNSERMVDEIQNSVRAYYALSQDKMFAEAKNFKEARTAVESWKRQYQMDDVTGESYLPADNFSNFVLHLAAMYKGESQSFIQNTFGKIYDLIQGTQEETLFEQPDNTPRTLVQAIKETFNLDYNGQQRSNVLFGDTVAQLSGSEYAMLKNNAEKNVRKYASRKKQWETDQTYIHNAKPRLKAFIKDAEKRIEDNGRCLEAVRSSFPDGQFKEIVTGKHRFTSVDTMDDFFKEHNKSVLAEMKQMKDGEISGEQKRELIIQIGDFSFVVTTKLTRKTMSDGATLFNDVERRMTYSCLELGIEDVPVRQNLLRNAVEDITDNVITGKDFAERLSAGERSKKHNEAELKELLSREGKPFEYEEELAQAKAQLEEYAELMKKELEEKEAKYAEMDASVETANNISASEEDDELKREGGGAYTDDEVSYENDPVAKLLGQSRRTAKQRREFAQRERQRMAERVEILAEKLHLDNVEIVTDASVLDGKKQRAKGFYSKSTGKITIVIPNHTSAFDVEQTLLHEAVAHYGLRQLFGEHFDTFLDNVFNNADENIRKRIVDMAAKNGWNFRKATEEYLASLAEQTEFENINASWWRQIKDFFLNMLHKIGFDDFRGVTLTDNELRYILWRSYENLAEPGRYRSILGEAADVAKQYELGVGNYSDTNRNPNFAADSNDELYRDGSPEMHERELARDRYERRVKTGMFQSQEALQDSMLGLKEAMQAILGQGTNIEDVDGFENAYLGENRLSSVNKAEADAFAHTLFKPMLDEVAKLARTEAEREELTDYMMAKHGLERNTYMRNEAINNGATNADQTDYAGLTALTGMDNVTDAETEAQIMVNDYEQAHDTADLWKKVNAVSKAILSKSYECGMMSKATFDKISDMYDFYIPLRGFDEKTSTEAYAYLTHKQSAFNAPIKKAEGRRSKADDPFANLQSMAEGAIMQGNRNKLVKQRFLNFALNHPSDLVSVSDIWVEYDTVTNEWKPVFPDNIDSTDTPEEVERKMLDFETKMKSLAQQYPDRYKHGKDTVNIPYRIVESRDMRQHQIIVKRGGRDYVITINGNPRAAQALNGQTNPDNDMSGAIGAILRAGENINRQLSAFYTTRNPDFIVSNFMRDMLYTNTMTWIRESPNYALRFHRNYMYANPVRIKQLLAKHRKGTLDMGNKTEAMFHQFMMNGGETGYANIRDIEQHKNDIRRELKKSSGKIPVKKAWDLLGERFDEYNRAVENCARFAAFMTSREMGRSIDRSIYDAKEISVNFNKKGSGAKFYDSTGQTKAGNASALVSGLGRSGYVFWNAAIQGTTNFGRQVKRHPAKSFTGIAAMFLLGAIVAYLGGDDDDDDDKNAYYNLPEYVRRSNILFRAGNSWVSIPLPVEYRAVYGMGELMISILNGKEHLTGGEIAESITGQVTQILPIDLLEGGGGLNAFVPSAYKPLWEAYVAEKSWTGMPLYKDTPWNKDMPEWTKAYKSANKYIVGLANVMNEATGGDSYTKGAIDFNPAKIEYMLNGYFGGVFGTIDKLSKTVETVTGNREYDPRSFLLANRLVKAGDERTEYRAVNNEYFRLKEEHDRLKSRLKHYEEDTDNDIFDYAEKIDFLYNSPEYERYEIFEDYRRDIDDLYNELNDTVDDEERKNIEAELNELKKEMIEEMNKTRK